MISKLIKNMLTSTVIALVLYAWPRIKFIMIEQHIDVRYHFIRSERRIKVHKINILHNHVDMFTQPVPKSKFDHCLSLLNVDCWG